MIYLARCLFPSIILLALLSFFSLCLLLFDQNQQNLFLIFQLFQLLLDILLQILQGLVLFLFLRKTCLLSYHTLHTNKII